MALEILAYILSAIIILGLIYIHINARKNILAWANKYEYKIIKMVFLPYYRHEFYTIGPHPAHFKVKIQNKDGQIKYFSIVVGGIFLLSGKLAVQKIKTF